MHPSKFIRDFIGFATSQYVVRLLLLLRGLIAARVLGPSAYGAWNGLMLLLDYGAAAPLGTIQGLDQSVPPRIVAGDAHALRRLKRAGLFNVLALNGTYALLCLGYFWRSSGQLRSFWHLGGIGLMLLTNVLANVAVYQMSVMRSHGNIHAVSLTWLLQALIGAGLGIALLPVAGAWGLLWGWFAGTVAMALYAGRSGGAEVPLAPAPSRDAIALLAIGFPMFAYLGISLLMRTVDRVLILRYLGTEALGFYGLAVMAMGILLYLPDALGYVLYPTLLRDVHAAGGDPEAIRDPVERSLRALSIALPALCAFVFIAADDLVLWLLPRFLPGVPTVRVLCFAAGALGLGGLSAIVVMAIRRPLALVPISLVSVALSASLAMGAIRGGYGIVGVAWATLVGNAVHSAALLWFALGGLHERPARRAGFVLRLFTPLALAIPLAWACNRFMVGAGQHGWFAALRLVLAIGAFAAIYLVLTLPLTRGLGLRAIVTELRLPGMGAVRRAVWGRPDGMAP